MTCECSLQQRDQSDVTTDYTHPLISQTAVVVAVAVVTLRETI